MPNALRISGWCHAWGNLMKEIAQCCPVWIRVLDQMRTMVTFYRNRTWRRWIKSANRGVADINWHLLDSFPCTMAKWRYETVALTMFWLAKLRVISQTRVRREMFANAQDKNFIDEAR